MKPAPGKGIRVHAASPHQGKPAAKASATGRGRSQHADMGVHDEELQFARHVPPASVRLQARTIDTQVGEVPAPVGVPPADGMAIELPESAQAKPRLFGSWKRKGAKAAKQAEEPAPRSLDELKAVPAPPSPPAGQEAAAAQAPAAPPKGAKAAKGPTAPAAKAPLAPAAPAPPAPPAAPSLEPVADPEAPAPQPPAPAARKRGRGGAGAGAGGRFAGMRPMHVVEAALFSAGKPLLLEEIVAQTGLPAESVKKAVVELQAAYAERDSVLEVGKAGAKWAMQVRSVAAEPAAKFSPPEIAAKLLKTLALIAYHQPMKQSELVDMIGTKVYDHVPELVERGLVRAREEGATKILTTTPAFPEYFGLDAATPDEIRLVMGKLVGIEAPPKPKESVMEYEQEQGAGEAAAPPEAAQGPVQPPTEGQTSPS